MTEREAFEQQYRNGEKIIIARRRLTEQEVRARLEKVYIQEYGDFCPASRYADDCIKSVQLTEVWTDSSIGCAVVYNAANDLYIIISTGKYFDLVEV